MTPDRPFVVLGVCGGISAYKVCEVLRGLTESGHDVQVVATGAALQFVGEPTWAALSGRPVATDVWQSAHEVPHVRLGRSADLVLVAPATADTLARMAHGRADDLLTATLLTARCPVLVAPAMHTEMWEHPATVDNVAVLRSRGVVVLDPAVGRLTGADTGAGRLPDPPAILDAALAALDRGAQPPDLGGRTLLVSAGGTREPLDPVRFLGNRSSGRQGYAVAAAAAARGARVVLVSANVSLPPPAGVELVAVGTAADLADAVLGRAAAADAIVMAAAVADFRPAARSASKLKKSDSDPEPVALERTIDVLAELVARRPPGQVVVGFAAETDHVVEHGRAKLAAKGCDLLVVNEVGDALVFDRADTAATILAADGADVDFPGGTKRALAHLLLDGIGQRLG